MASQFQHRVVGAVVLVALGVIILPGVLDGDKKHYQNEFAAIPIIPVVEDNQTTAELPPANQGLTNVVPEANTTTSGNDVGAAPVVDSNIDNGALTTTNNAANQTTSQTTNQTTNPVVTTPPTNAASNSNNTTHSTSQNSNQTTTQSTIPSTTTQTKPNQTAPKGKAYVVQLGAFKNVEGIEKVKAQLSFANYTVFTIPAKPVQGQTTRILVGPDASRQKLQAALPELERLTGLKGVVREHTVTN